MVDDVARRLVVVHAGHRVSERHPLVECGEGTEADTATQRRLADQQAGEGRAAVHLRVGQEPQTLQLLGIEKVSLVEDEDHLSPPL